MKVGKESILGLTKAIELYITMPNKETGQQMVEKMTPFINNLNTLQGITAKVVWDSAGRDIARAEISFNDKILGKNALEMVKLMKEGETAIYFREYKANEGKVDADVRSVTSEQLDIIYNKIKQIIKG